MTEVTTLQVARRRVQFRPQSPDAYDGVMAASVFELLDEGVERVDIVKRLEVDPRAVAALYGEWVKLKGGFVVESKEAAAIEALPWLCGKFPIQDGARLLANLQGSIWIPCTGCETAAPTLCARCACAVNAREASRRVTQEREKAAQRDHEQKMAAQDREMERRRKANEKT